MNELIKLQHEHPSHQI